MLVNLGVVHQNGEVVPYWNELAKRLQSDGFKFFGQYVWHQGSGLPGDWGGRLATSHEYVFHFNQQPRQINKIVKCQSAGMPIHGSEIKNNSGVGKQRAPGVFVNENKIPDSVFRVERCLHPGIEANHPARFPVAFADFLIRAFGQFGDIILDPFAGSGTTLYAAKQLNYRCIGIDVEERYCEMAAKRCSQEVLQLNVAQDSGAKPVQRLTAAGQNTGNTLELDL